MVRVEERADAQCNRVCRMRWNIPVWTHTYRRNSMAGIQLNILERTVMNAKDEVIDWLRDAYAMERGLEVVLKKAANREIYPNVIRFATGKHLEETRQHADMLAGLLKSLGSDTSNIKTGAGVMANALAGFGTMMTRDELIKDLLVSYAAEHFEIACYRALIAAARMAGLPNVVAACESIIANEEQMAATITQALPQIVEGYLDQQQRAKAA